LPTEAEWEYAAKGGQKSNGYIYSGSNNSSNVAWYDGGNSSNTTQEVGQLSSNELGIYDMSGNVWEWCSDLHKDYSGSSGVGFYRVLRGGSWYDYVSDIRIINRNYADPSHRGNSIGFRIVLVP